MSSWSSGSGVGGLESFGLGLAARGRDLCHGLESGAARQSGGRLRSGTPRLSLALGALGRLVLSGLVFLHGNWLVWSFLSLHSIHDCSLTCRYE